VQRKEKSLILSLFFLTPLLPYYLLYHFFNLHAMKIFPSVIPCLSVVGPLDVSICSVLRCARRAILWPGGAAGPYTGVFCRARPPGGPFFTAAPNIGFENVCDLKYNMTHEPDNKNNHGNARHFFFRRRLFLLLLGKRTLVR
jgi:hypothetical protein